MLNRIAVLLVGIMCCLAMQAQENVIDLGRDTIYYDADYEYVIAFETETYMESYVFYQSALEAYKRNDILSAKAKISKAIKLNKEEVKFKMLKAWIASKDQSYKKAIKIANKIIETSDKHKEAYYCKALNHFLLGEYTSANIGFSHLINLSESDFQAYFGRAETKMKLEDIQGAIGDYSKALNIKPTMSSAYKGRGIAYSKIYDFKKAIIDFNQALTVKPNDGELYYYRAICYLRLNDFANACKNFEQAVELNHKEATSYYNKNCKF